MAKFTGLKSLQAKLKRIPIEARSAIKQALAESADEIVAMQRNLAPKKSRALEESIVATFGDGSVPKYAAFQSRSGRKTIKSNDPDLSVTITAGNNKVRYAHLVEFGTKAHVIKAKNAKAMGKDGIFGTKVDHPGAEAKPFFYPAYRALRKRVKGRISRATNRAAKQVASGGGGG